MKHLKSSLLLILLVMMGCIFLKAGDVKAAESVYFEEFVCDEFDDFMEYTFRLKCKCRLTIYMESRTFYEDYDEYYEDEEMYVLIEDDDIYPDTVWETAVDYGDSYEKTITLKAGEYTLCIEGPGYVSLSGEYYPELSSKNMTLEEGRTKKLKVNGTSSKVKWSSSKRSVATVNHKGVVKAKKAGKAIIMAECEGKILECKVTVEKKPASYRVIARKMSTFAKKNKYYKFKNVDVGNKCCLYACSAEGLSSQSKLYSEGYAMYSYLYPYIELVRKKNGEAEIRLKFYGEIYKASAYDVTSLYCSTLKALTSNRRLDFVMKNTSNRNFYNYSGHYFEGEMKGYSIVSTSSKVELSKLKKFKTMLKQNSLSMRITSSDGAYMQIPISMAERKNWYKLLKEYDLLLKEF